MNRNFGKLDENHKICYAPNNVRIGGTIYAAPTAEQYAECGYLPIDSTKPEKVGVYFISTEYGDLVDGRIVRRYDERPVVAPPLRYKVEEIIYGLIEADALQAVKALVGDYWELFTMRDKIDAENEIWAAKFPTLRAAIVAQGILTDAQIDAILKDAEVC